MENISSEMSGCIKNSKNDYIKNVGTNLGVSTSVTIVTGIGFILIERIRENVKMNIHNSIMESRWREVIANNWKIYQ